MEISTEEELSAAATIFCSTSWTAFAIKEEISVSKVPMDDNGRMFFSAVFRMNKATERFPDSEELCVSYSLQSSSSGRPPSNSKTISKVAVVHSKCFTVEKLRMDSDRHSPSGLSVSVDSSTPAPRDDHCGILNPLRI